MKFSASALFTLSGVVLVSSLSIGRSAVPSDSAVTLEVADLHPEPAGLRALAIARRRWRPRRRTRAPPRRAGKLRGIYVFRVPSHGGGTYMRGSAAATLYRSRPRPVRRRRDIARAGRAALAAERTQRGRRIAGGEGSGRHARHGARSAGRGRWPLVRREYACRLTSWGVGIVNWHCMASRQVVCRNNADLVAGRHDDGVMTGNAGGRSPGYALR